MGLAVEAKQFLRSTHSGMLSTFSTKFAGYPFGSVTPFVLDHHGQPIVLISDIAEHTKNIIVNPKVSLLVFEPLNLNASADLQANSRLTLIGTAEKLTKNDANLMARYCRYLPESSDYFAMHDFNFYRIHIHQARFIAGFGKMGWLNGDEVVNVQNQDHATQIAALETDMIAHMNADHNDSMLLYCKHFYNMQPNHVSLLGIDTDGFDIEATFENSLRILRFQFESPIFDANSARAAFVALTKQVRS